MRGHITMSKKERRRLLVMSRVREQGMSLRCACSVLGLSYRQTRRIYKRFLTEGDKGLVHRNRGKTSGRALEPGLRQTALELYKSRYDDFGPTLAAEKLFERDGITIDHETLRRYLIKAGLWKRRRKSVVHRQRRIPKEHFGELVQMDGSHHRWFEERGDMSCLMNMVDDATGTTLAIMDKEETTEIAMRALWAWIEKYGIPEALYVDHKNVFETDREPTIEEQLKGEIPLTRFGHSCEKLGINIICADSPQAKGRVERNHAVYQDRLVKEFRLEDVSTIDGANRLLASGFIESLNARFAKAPADPLDWHRRVGRDTYLEAIFSFEDTRVVACDFTIRYQGRRFQITKQNPLPRPKDKITVQRRLDGAVHLICQGRYLEFVELSIRPDGQLQKAAVGTEQLVKPGINIPTPNHPWRRGWSPKPAVEVSP